MALILNIETATRFCSVSIGKNRKLLALKEISDESYAHSENLTTFINEIVSESGISLKDIDAVAVSMGPGSYTGLRIGVSTAKGLCFALDKPLIGIETLKAMACGVLSLEPIEKRGLNVLLCPMLDARRMEVYCAFFNSQLELIRTVSAEIINENSFGNLLQQNLIYFFGEGSAKCRPEIRHANAKFLTGKEYDFPSAKNMAELSEEKFNTGKFEDLATFEPFYLKDFVGTKLPNPSA